MRLRLLQTLYRKQSICTDSTRQDYEENEEDSLTSSLSSSLSTIFSPPLNHCLRQSTSSIS
jgi:hypothetical protein